MIKTFLSLAQVGAFYSGPADLLLSVNQTAACGEVYPISIVS